MDTTNWNGITILVVEDSPTQLQTIRGILQRSGAKVIEAVNGEEGFQKAKESSPAIIISDIEMPVLNGYELCRNVKDDPALFNVPFILLTNLKDPMDVISGISCGADNFLTKPCSERLLISSIDDAIENRKRERKRENAPELEFSYNGKKHRMRVNQAQIIDLLLSTYASAMEKNRELEKTNRILGSFHLELQQKNEELSKLINDKNLLLGMAAHDLRNPLHAIQAYSEILEMKTSESDDENLIRMIKTIRRQSKFMLDLVNNLLNISVIDLGKLKLNLQQSNLKQLVQSNCKLNESIADQKSISIHLTCDDAIPSVWIDPNKIEQVLNNLINNAIKYSHPGSIINVCLKKNASDLIFSVQDHGIGIAEGDTENLFETIAKKRASGTIGEPSTGLGLAIVKRIIEEHKGKIWIKSKLGEGSTFFFSLPCEQKPEDFAISFQTAANLS